MSVLEPKVDTDAAKIAALTNRITHEYFKRHRVVGTAFARKCADGLTAVVILPVTGYGPEYSGEGKDHVLALYDMLANMKERQSLDARVNMKGPRYFPIDERYRG